MSYSLTCRETECLFWTGHGKTAAEIAKILTISHRTVEAHINSAVIKLNAVNKTHAIAKLSRLNAVEHLSEFSKETVALTRYHQDGPEILEIIKRRNIPPFHFDDEDETFAKMLEVWKQLRRDERTPDIGRTHALLDSLGSANQIHMVHVADLKTFVYEHVAGDVTRSLRDKLKSNTVDSFASHAMKNALRDDFAQVARGGIPTYHHIVASLNKQDYSYSRLILPFSDSPGHVSRLLVRVQRRIFDDWVIDHDDQ
jgi:DNA-binding CsgD family transcriptional regulator